MKNLTAVLIIFFSTGIFAQEANIDTLIANGNDAFMKNDFVNAKKYYSKAIDIDTTNKDGHFNLAMTELKLENKERACELLQKCYQLRDIGAVKFIKEHCGEIAYTESMFFEHVDEIPKFKMKDKVHDLIINGNLHPKLLSLLQVRAAKSRILQKIETRAIMVEFKIDRNGNFISKAKGKNVSPKVDQEIKKIFDGIAEYIPATYQNKNVGLWQSFTIPLVLKK